MGIDAGFSWLPECQAMTLRWTSQGMTSSSSASVQVARSVVAGCYAASRGCWERECHSDVF